jgi:hypothetical protein
MLFAQKVSDQYNPVFLFVDFDSGHALLADGIVKNFDKLSIYYNHFQIRTFLY